MQILLENKWIVPPGRYHAVLSQVKEHDADSIRLVFKLQDGKKAGKHYSTKKPYWLEKDICSWLCRDRLQKLAVNNIVTAEQLSTLIGTEAVVVVTNENHGQEVPLIVISEILPNTPENLKGKNTSGPSFRMSPAFCADGSAMAA